MQTPSDDDVATIHLTPDEALVLFELLSRWSDGKGRGKTPSPECFVSTAEPVVLNKLLAYLERQLVAPFKKDYDRILKQPRDRLARQLVEVRRTWTPDQVRGDG